MSTPTSIQRPSLNASKLRELATTIKRWGREIGFDEVGIADTDLAEHEEYLNKWLSKGMQGEMSYMAKHGLKRSRPAMLVEGTKRIIIVRLDYAPEDIRLAEQNLLDKDLAYVSRYALGRDYHKVLRGKLKTLAQRISAEIGEFGYRVFTDSAPVLEKALAEKAGLGWIGKHSNLIDAKSGSWFFLGELYVDLELPIDEPASNHCGTCSRCIDLCPTQAIVGPYQVDARRCISYLTIELRDAIPTEFRKPMGNRIYGCDDCQLVCPWNKFAQPTRETDFHPRAELSDKTLQELFNWSEESFLSNTEGTAIRRIGYASWLRNIAVALGNAQASTSIITQLERKRRQLSESQQLADRTEMVIEHIDWALAEQRKAQALSQSN